MSQSRSQSQPISASSSLELTSSSTRYVHAWARAMAIMTFPLIWVGGLVTTYDAGMAVPDWPGTYGYNLFLYPISTWVVGPFDLFVEHGHRLLASLVGLLAIGFLVATLRGDHRRWMHAWALFMLVAVIAQGILGGYRVLADARAMAMIHGCTGPAFFALAAATAVMTSPWWRSLAKTSPVRQSQPNPSQAEQGRGAPSRPTSRWGSFLFYLLPPAAFCQLIIGAQLRHIQPWTPPARFLMWVHLHLTLAAVVTLLIFWVAYRARSISATNRRPLARPASILFFLVVVQLGLGFATWISNYAIPWQDWLPWFARYTIEAKGFTESWIVTGHQAVGSLILALSTVLAMRLGRHRYLHVD